MQQRILGLLVLLVGGFLSLPLVAAAFDGEGSENWILPVQLGGMALLGAAVGTTLPGLVGADATLRRRALVGALIGVVMAGVGVIVFFVLLNGFGGA